MIAKSIAVSLGSNYIHLLFSIDVSGPLAHRIGEYLNNGPMQYARAWGDLSRPNNSKTPRLD